LNAFMECTGLTEVIFAADSHLRTINGFRGCRSLSRLEIPASVEEIGSSTSEIYPSSQCLGDLSRRELVLDSGTRLKRNAKRDDFRGFMIFKDENDMKRRRRQVHV
jgi:hypothetical protein